MHLMYIYICIHIRGNCAHARKMCFQPIQSSNNSAGRARLKQSQVQCAQKDRHILTIFAQNGYVEKIDYPISSTDSSSFS